MPIGFSAWRDHTLTHQLNYINPAGDLGGRPQAARQRKHARRDSARRGAETRTILSRRARAAGTERRTRLTERAAWVSVRSGSPHSATRGRGGAIFALAITYP